MSKKIVDARQKLCPVPLIMTKRALEELADGEQLTVLIDNETSKDNVERFLRDNKLAVQTAHDGELFTLTVASTSEGLLQPDAEKYCSLPAQNGPHVVCFKNKAMGFGPEELGGILVRACINTLKEISPLPKAIIFYNSGVELALSTSPVIESLKELESLGVEILVCGTCADYFAVKEQVAVGQISNMYTILEKLSGAQSVIYP